MFAQENVAIGKIETRLGTIYLHLFDDTPYHRASFIQLATAGYWDSLSFNRVIPDFVAQAGCPDTDEGFTDPEYLLKPEIMPHLTHVYGAVGAGRDDNAEKLSATCQFYIIHRSDGVHRLDGDYTIFGQVIEGMDVVDAIVKVPRDSSNQPLEPISMKISIEYWPNQQIKNTPYQR
jgi:peptidyl-prolyl cis-trans isomerase B (cyclophilin B)